MNLNRHALRAWVAGIGKDLRTPRAVLPWSWSDSGGLYYGRDGAWLYFDMPLALIATVREGAAPGLDEVLVDLAERAGGRQVHVLSHAWEQEAAPPPGLPPALAEHQRDSLRLFVPARCLTVGVQIRPDDAALKRSLKQTIVDEVDRVLGEHVPDLSVYDADRDTVANVLGSWGGTAIDGATQQQLESWYTLGTARDLEIIERDDAIGLPDHTVIEVAAVLEFAPEYAGAAVALPSPGPGGAAVVSVRGHLTERGKARQGAREDRTGSLSKASIVLARRMQRPLSTWLETLSELPGIEVKPLPLRQVAGLEETLPCSVLRLNATLPVVTAAHLAAAGACEPTPVADRTGALLGLASPDFAYPCYLNPTLDLGRTTAITGRADSGKTFLLEHVAIQLMLADLHVAVLTDLSALPDPCRDDVLALWAQAGARFPAATDGAFDPFVDGDPALAAKVLLGVLSQYAGLDALETQTLQLGLRRAVRLTATSSLEAVGYVDEPRTAAKVLKFLRRDPLGRLFARPDEHAHPGAGSVPAAGAVVFDTGALLVHLTATDRAAATAHLAAALACGRGTSPRIVAVDGLDASQAAALALTEDGGPSLGTHLLVSFTSAADLAASPLRGSIRTFIGLGVDNDADANATLELTGTAVRPDRVEWLRTLDVHLEDGIVHQPAVGLIRDRYGRRASLLCAPVALERLTLLTRGNASRYLIDAANEIASA